MTTILAIDTSALASVACLRQDGAGATVLGSFNSADTRSHAEITAPAVQQVLDAAAVAGTSLDAIVVGVGPGPFTGLRAGLAVAQTLAFAWDVPVHGVMSLGAIAWEATAAGERGEFLVATDARRKEVYWARFAGHDGGPQLLDGPHVTLPAQVPAAGLPVYGAGAGLYPAELTGVPDFTDRHPDAAALGAFALSRLQSGEPLLGTTPLYLRESDAQVPGPRKKAL